MPKKKKKDPEYSSYGGMAGTRFPSTGFFYTTKHNGRWWLVDPEGHAFYANVAGNLSFDDCDFHHNQGQPAAGLAGPRPEVDDVIG